MTADHVGFDKTSPSAAVVAPLSIQRVATILDADGDGYQQVDENRLGGFWNGHHFWFVADSDDRSVLVVAGEWNRTVATDEFNSILQIANEWNDQKYWPKVFLRVAESGSCASSLKVRTTVTADYGTGVTDALISTHIDRALGSSMSFFEHLDQIYPEAAALAKAEFAAEIQENQ